MLSFLFLYSPNISISMDSVFTILLGMTVYIALYIHLLAWIAFYIWILAIHNVGSVFTILHTYYD